MAHNLSVEEIFRKVVEAARSLNNYELRTVRVTNKAGRNSEESAQEIRVGNDYYRRWERAIGPDEWLDYRGRVYTRRSPEGAWSEPEPAAWATGEIIGTGTPPSWDDALYSPNYRLDFNRCCNAEQLPDEVLEGRSAIRLAANEVSRVPAWNADEILRRLPARNEENERRLRAMLSEELGRRPDSVNLRYTFWIDAETFALLKVGLGGTSYRAGEVVESFVETQIYSRLNEAELPGPLPD
jgi:hypothetical protein